MASNSSNKPLAAIYAQALLEAAQAVNSVEQVAAEVGGLNEALKKDKRFAEFFESPTISFDQKRKVLDAALAGHSAITRNLLLVVTERGRSAIFPEIVDAYNEYIEKKAGIASVEVTSASPLQEYERDRLVHTLGGKLGKKIKLTERVNPELIGGMVVVHGDKMWDGSLRSKLNVAVHKMEELQTAAVKWE